MFCLGFARKSRVPINFSRSITSDLFGRFLLFCWEGETLRAFLTLRGSRYNLWNTGGVFFSGKGQLIISIGGRFSAFPFVVDLDSDKSIVRLVSPLSMDRSWEFDLLFYFLHRLPSFFRSRLTSFSSSEFQATSLSLFRFNYF
jgi:hypothetical protein